MTEIRKIIQNSIAVKQNLLTGEFVKQIEAMAKKVSEAFGNDNKVLLCGNGGSAADAAHIATELSGRFYMDRKPLYAEALSVNMPNITAISNDYGYENVFARLVEGKGRKDDILIALSTSGNSPNVVNAIVKAKELGLYVIGMTGEDGGEMNTLCDLLIKVPSSDTPRIQEAHILIGHIVCQQVEKNLFE